MILTFFRSINKSVSYRFQLINHDQKGQDHIYLIIWYFILYFPVNYIQTTHGLSLLRNFICYSRLCFKFDHCNGTAELSTWYQEISLDWNASSAFVFLYRTGPTRRPTLDGVGFVPTSVHTLSRIRFALLWVVAQGENANWNEEITYSCHHNSCITTY